MELTLTRQGGTQVQVSCNGHPSHSFDLSSLIPAAEGRPGPPQPLTDPITYGKAAYQALFPADSPARRTVDATTDRILLVTTDNGIDAVPWEYAYGPDGFLVTDYPFVRGLPPDQRIAPPTLDGGLHIVAIPSDPLDKRLNPLNIDGEWMRLQENIRKVPGAVNLERAYPPTIEQVRSQLANRRHRVVHFMGHGGQDDDMGTFLCLEKENGTLDPVTAKQFVQRMRGSVFLVTLNACVSATPGPTPFSNLAAAITRQKVPYALGMRLSIHDDDARAFSRQLYSELVSGVPVEEALFQARLTLAKSIRRWAIGVPVLYTSLSEPAGGYAALVGVPTIDEHRPLVEVFALPRAEGGFQGRIDELAQLGSALTGDERPPVITIHGSGGQGKTALAREAVERFAFAWPGGIWAISLEYLPSREVFLTSLARFLGIAVQEITQQEELERQVLLRLSPGQPRTLIVLDNVETLIEAAHANDIAATNLAQFIRTYLTRPPVSLLVTSRRFLDWQGELGLELEGLLPDDGAKLFQQSAPRRSHEIEPALAEELSRKVVGHPLSLRLLGGAFNQITLSLPEFILDCDTHLLAAEDKYIDVGHRQRTLYACIETSVRYLDADLLHLFSRLWIFHAPFLPESAVAIFDPEFDETKGERSPIYEQLYALWLRGLLVHEREPLREGTVELYSLLPTMCPYIENYLARAEEREEQLARFGSAYALLAHFLFRELDHGGTAAFIAEQSREDLERGATFATGLVQGYYLLYWGGVLHRTGYTRHGLQLTEQALEIGQGKDRKLVSAALNNMGEVYRATGQPRRALELYEQALPLKREVGDREGEADTLNNMALAYHATGQPKRALELYEQTLLLSREVGDRAGEATTFNNMALLYGGTGQPRRALELYEQALPLMREVGDRAGEATTLNNMGEVYRATGQPRRALELYEQALPLMREVGDRAGEATMLNNMGEVYRATGQLERALELYEQALPLKREVGDREGEADTLNNTAGVYRARNQLERALELCEQAFQIYQEVGNRAREATMLNNIAELCGALGQLKRALALCEQALPLRREVGDRAGEAITLNNMAGVYRATGQPRRALELCEQSSLLLREVGDRAGEAATLANMAVLLYQDLNQRQDATNAMQQAIAVLDETGLPQTAGGNTRDELQQYLDAIRQGTTVGQAGQASTMPIEQLQVIVRNTIVVMTTMQERRAEWHKTITGALQNAQQRGANWQIEVDFYIAVLALLDGQTSSLPGGHPYAAALAQIQAGIAAGGVPEDDDMESEGDESSPDESSTDLFEMMVSNTLAVLGPLPEKLPEWHATLLQWKEQAAQVDARGLVALLDAIVGLLDAGGNPEGLGANLTGEYVQVWQALVEALGK